MLENKYKNVRHYKDNNLREYESIDNCRNVLCAK